MEIACVVDARAELGEGTVWDPVRQVLWWIDIYGPTIHQHDPATGENRSWQAPEYLGCIGLRHRGGLVLTMASGFYFFDPVGNEFSFIADPESHLSDTRFNDGKTDRQGRFWSGTMFESAGKTPQKTGALYRLDADHTVHRMLDGIGCANGLAWSPDGKKMYFTDSHTSLVWVFDVEPETGDIFNRRIFIDLSPQEYIVDGATVDAAGNYWLTVPFKSKVMAFDPGGKLMREITLPVDLPTCCEFGGANLDILYVTSARYRRSDEELKAQEFAGGLLAITGLGHTGLTLPAYRG